jgi:hypothetical protein
MNGSATQLPPPGDHKQAAAPGARLDIHLVIVAPAVAEALHNQALQDPVEPKEAEAR